MLTIINKKILFYKKKNYIVKPFFQKNKKKGNFEFFFSMSLINLFEKHMKDLYLNICKNYFKNLNIVFPGIE